MQWVICTLLSVLRKKEVTGQCNPLLEELVVFDRKTTNGILWVEPGGCAPPGRWVEWVSLTCVDSKVIFLTLNRRYWSSGLENNMRDKKKWPNCSRRHGGPPGGGRPCGWESELPGWHPTGRRGWVLELVHLSLNSSVGNFPLSEKLPSHHPSAFLKCLTVLGAW